MLNRILNLLGLFFEKPFRIGIISYYYPFQKPSTSGVGTHVYNLVTNLTKLGCDVHVFTYSERNDYIHKMKMGEGKIIIHSIKAVFPFEIEDNVISKRVRYSIFENRVLNEVSLENSRKNFDVIHTHGWLTSSAFMLKYLYKLPWIHTVHALERNRLSSMTLEEKKLYRLTSWIEDTIIDADKLIAVSESTSKELIKSFGDKISKKIEVIPNGVDLNLFTPPKDFPKTVLSVTRFSKEKGIEMMPEIIEKVLSEVENSKFILIAQENKISALKSVQDKLINLIEKYSGRFEWVSKPLMQLEIAPYYKKSSVYVQPSLYEAFGLCIIEAMASGNAIVATNVGGVSEVVDNAGIVVKADTEQISSAVVKLLNSKSLRKKYRKMSLERAKIYDWSLIARKVLDLYKQVIEKKKARSMQVPEIVK